VPLAGNARAQLPPPPPSPFEQRSRPSENALQQAESERLHRAALKTIPDRKPSNDPWHNMRSAVPDPAVERHRPQ
jgi:hypothetical protein